MSDKTAAHPWTARQIVLIACATCATYLGASMGSAFSLVMPRIASDLQASGSQVQWIISGFLLARIGCLRPAGMLCDRLGARAIFLVGMAGYAASSLACAWADDAALLIALRIAQGAFAALLSPSALLLLRLGVPPAKQPFVMSIWSAAGVAGFGLSPVLGGAMVNAWGWHSLLVFTAAATALTGVVAFAQGPDATAAANASRQPSKLPVLHELIVSIVLVALAFFVGQKDAVAVLLVVGAAAAMLAALVMFTRGGRQLGAEDLQLALRILAPFCAGMFGFAAIAAAMLWAAYFIQTDLHHSALVFGLACLPMAVVGIAASFGTGSLVAANRSNLAFLLAAAAVLGLALSAFGAEAGQSTGLAALVLACAGACYGFSNASATAGIIASFPAGQSGDASALGTLSKQYGQLIGITVVASTRDLTGKTAGVGHGLFYFLAACALVLVLCAGIGAMRGRREPTPLPAAR
ncbi:MFS transporter [Variovorax sp. J22P168]|uniref:MFS transporter n=1 Tax=Variovorax jilinensis TaxID=3053513 RepID=UPI0025773C2F|nr:MFS transporter [Variovorax sp. J22P168]MDM0014982.1 MFS transporter [Variovorax sp. J22P168]